MTSQDRPKYVLKMVRLVCEKVVHSGPKGQWCVRCSDDWLRDMKVYTFSGYGSKLEDACKIT